MRNLIVAVLLLITSALYAQIQVGARAGTHAGTVYFGAQEEFAYQERFIGYSGGLVLEYIHRPTWSVRFEANMSQMGWDNRPFTIVNQVQLVDTQYVQRINYLEVPFLAHFFMGGERSKVMILLGPYAAYALNSTYKQQTFNTVETGSYTFVDSLDNRLIYGIIASIGYQHDSRIGTFQLEARLTQAVRHFKKPESRIKYKSDKSLYQCFGVSLTYLLPTKKQKRRNNE